MAQLTPSQLAWRRRIEAGLRLAAPALDLVLAAGDRLSRTVDRDGLDGGPLPTRVRSAEVQRTVEAGHRAEGAGS
ncbi:hypothetical protein [Conexibacter sp. SYSU D00693]|uniref:hypothetical protein n=1 Tax=Conexibacter sp. SYSU D00693 TaxID=2812560 RepID=UPI00196A6734|nr:hypothetical protein [Conexibacter sp. SYSU D00693]